MCNVLYYTFPVTAGFQISSKLSVIVPDQSLFAKSHRLMEVSAGNPDVLFRYENYGRNWTFGIKSRF